MAKKRSKCDPRLRGTWRSDRRLTFKHFTPRHGSTPAKLRKFKAVFGKLIVHWQNGYCNTEFDGAKSRERYEIVASDSVSVVIRYFHDVLGEERLQQIFFEDDYYWFWTVWGMREFFRRVPILPRRG